MLLCNDHQHCIDEAIAKAKQVCQARQARLTPQRLEVLKLIWRSHRPLGAYDLMDQLSAGADKRVAPPTVYRALDFLLEQGLIHRINSLNAFIGCPNPDAHQERQQAHYFLICEQCQQTEEIIEDTLNQHILDATTKQKFKPRQQWLEVNGLCHQCQS